MIQYHLADDDPKAQKGRNWNLNPYHCAHNDAPNQTQAQS